MKVVTVQSLIDLKACKDQIELFQETFDDSCELTKENLQRAIDVKLDLEWWTEKIYGFQAIKPYYSTYHTAKRSHWDAYQAAVQPHWDVYEAAKRSHWDAYLTSPDWYAYKEAVKPHWNVCSAAIKPHLDAYNKAKKLCLIDYQNSLIEFVLSKQDKQ